MSRIMREVVVLGRNPQTSSIDWQKADELGLDWKSATPEARDKFPRIEVVPITFLRDIESHTKENGYVGDLTLYRYECPAADKAILDACVSGTSLLLYVEQTLYKSGKRAGTIGKRVTGVKSLKAGG